MYIDETFLINYGVFACKLALITIACFLFVLLLVGSIAILIDKIFEKVLSWRLNVKK